jgi:hypothetical protein
VLKERSPLAPNLKGLESSVWEPSCKEYGVSMAMSYQEGPDGHCQKPVTREAPGSPVARPAPKKFFSDGWPFLSSQEWWGHTRYGMCGSPTFFVARGNRAYSDGWEVTKDPWYPGYNTPTAAPEPSVERVAGVGHSMVGRTGSHMVPWVVPWDSVVRLWG